MDGRAIQIFLSQVADSYSRITKSLPLPEIHSGSRAHSKIYKGLTFPNRLAAAVLMKNISRIKEKRTFAYTKEDPTDKLEMITVKWSGEEISAIRTAAKKNGATVNDLLLSFYAYALYETCDFPKEEPLTITCMVDNRRHIQDKESTGLTNHVGLMQIRVDGCGSTINHTVSKMTKITVRGKKKRFFGLSGIPLIRLGYYLPFFLVKPGTLLWFLNPLLGFSNLGIVQEDLFKLGKLNVVDGLFFGPVQYKPYISLNIHMMCNALCFSVAIRGNDKDRQKILQLFDTMKHHMNAFVNEQHPATEA